MWEHTHTHTYTHTHTRSDVTMALHRACSMHNFMYKNHGIIFTPHACKISKNTICM